MAHHFDPTVQGMTNMSALNKKPPTGARHVTRAHDNTSSVGAGHLANKRAKPHTTPTKVSNAAINDRLTQAGRAVPLKQPTPGQLVASGVITAQ
jgi:hypothetical protein